MLNITPETAAQKTINGVLITKDEAESLAKADVYELLCNANKVRTHFKGKKLKLCSIINAKSGMCSENCAFCSQSSHNHSKTEVYPVVPTTEIENTFNKAKTNKASCYGIVTSGNTLTETEFEKLCASAKQIAGKGLSVSFSIGKISKELFAQIKKAGVTTIHHNLETSESFFPNICTTHTYAERVATAKLAKEQGLKLCCGGLFGLGETVNQRIELALALRKIGVDSVPINFLNPMPGTKYENKPKLAPLEALSILALFRFILPDKDISVCGGRETVLGDLQSWAFYAGANGMMVGGYLTTSGRNAEMDLKMIKDLGYEVANDR